MEIKQIWRKVRVFGLGDTIDKRVTPQQIDDPTLAQLWADAQVKMNEIQLYFETELPEILLEKSED